MLHVPICKFGFTKMGEGGGCNDSRQNETSHPHNQEIDFLSSIGLLGTAVITTVSADLKQRPFDLKLQNTARGNVCYFNPTTGVTMI